MATITINLSDELQHHLALRAAETGCKSVDEYVEALICADFDEDEYDEQLEKVLLERVNDPERIEFPEFIKQFDERMAKRRQSIGNEG